MFPEVRIQVGKVNLVENHNWHEANKTRKIICLVEIRKSNRAERATYTCVGFFEVICLTTT